MAAWVITFDGQVFHQDDLTIDEVDRWEKATNTTWRFLNPFRSAGHGRAILEILLTCRTGMSEDEAKRKVGALKANDFLNLFSEAERDADLPTQFDNGFPPEADESSIPT